MQLLITFKTFLDFLVAAHNLSEKVKADFSEGYVTLIH